MGFAVAAVGAVAGKVVGAVSAAQSAAAAVKATKIYKTVSTIAKVAGVISKIGAAKRAADTQASIYEYNRQVALQEAAQKRRAILFEQAARRDEMRRFLSKRRAQYAKAGVLMEGTPLETQLEVIEIYEKDIANVTWDLELGIRRDVSQAGIERYKASAAKRAGKIGVGEAIIGGIGGLTKMGIESQLNR